LYLNENPNDNEIDLLRFYLAACLDGRKVSAYTLVDSGATDNFISETFLNQLLERNPSLYVENAGIMRVRQANTISPVIQRRIIQLPIKFPNGYTQTVRFTAFNLRTYDLVLGKRWHRDTPHEIDHIENTLTFLDKLIPTVQGLRPHDGRHMHQHRRTVAQQAGFNHLLVTRKEFNRLLKDGWSAEIADIREYQAEENEEIYNLETENDADKNQKDLDPFGLEAEFEKEFPSVFRELEGLPPSRGNLDVRIPLEPGAKPPYRPPYRMSFKEEEAYKEIITKLLSNGWVSKSKSHYGCPVIFVKKPNTDELRMCIDYRPLNKIMLKDRYALPLIDALMDRLNGASLFTKLDLHSGYHQLRIHPNGTEKTAFVTPDGLYEWKVFPFGLANAPAGFMRLVTMF
jgi:hypothetical protein